MKAIYFDMDGTIASLYSVENWLSDLENHIARPYREAKPMVNMRSLGRLLKALQSNGYHIGIVSWLSRSGDEDYNALVSRTKMRWLDHHLGSVQFDEIHIVPYGTPKQSLVEFTDGILFDDEERNRNAWLGEAHDEKNILEILENLLTL